MTRHRFRGRTSILRGQKAVVESIYRILGMQNFILSLG